MDSHRGPSILETYKCARVAKVAEIFAQARSMEIRGDIDMRSGEVRKSPPVIDLRSPDQPSAEEEEDRQPASVGEDRVKPAIKSRRFSEWYATRVGPHRTAEVLPGMALPSARDPTSTKDRESFPINSRLPSINEWYPRLPSIDEWYPRLPSIDEWYPRIPSIDEWYPRIPSIDEWYPRIPSIPEWYPPPVPNSIVTSPVPARHEHSGAIVTVADPPSLQSSLLNTPTRLTPNYPPVVPREPLEQIQPPRASPYYHGEGRKRGRTLGDDGYNDSDGNLRDSARPRKIPRRTALELGMSDNDGGSYHPSDNDGTSLPWYQQARPRLPRLRRKAESLPYTLY